MSDELNRRVKERTKLLDRIVRVLKAERRVQAAWLWGSFGEGRQDSWSDLDLVLAVEDEAYEQISFGRREFVAQVQEPLICVEAPQNGPPGGMYLMAVYDAPTGPHCVDWQWQPARYARQPESKRILIANSSLLPRSIPIPELPAAQYDPTPYEDDVNKASLFWAMILIQAKYIARDPDALGMKFEVFILSLLRDVAAFHGVEVRCEPDLEIAEPALKFEKLRGYCVLMSKSAPMHSTPHRSVEGFLNFVERNAVSPPKGK